MRKYTSAALSIAVLLCIFIVLQENAMIFSPHPSLSNKEIDVEKQFVVALDNSGNFTNIQNAIDAVPSLAKGLILIREGIYDLNPGFLYPFQSIIVRSRITIVGAGVDRTIIRSFPIKNPSNSTNRAMSVTSTGDVVNLTIENLTIVQNSTPDNLGFGAIDLRGGSSTNVTIRNVKVTDVAGAAIAIRRFSNITVENCIIERAWTGIVIGGGSNGLVKGNRISNTTGDAVFAHAIASVGLRVTDLELENNYIENAGDTGIDITSAKPSPPHERIIARSNFLKNAHFRVTYSHEVWLENNTIEGGYIDVDNGVGDPVNVLVEGNTINTSYKVAIGFYGAQNSSAIDNFIAFYSSTTTIQVGISASIRGAAFIEGNTVINSTSYGIDFGGWRLGGECNMTIRNNKLLDFGKIGIYDNGLAQSNVVLENNLVWDRREPFASQYGIRTDEQTNHWTIRYNQVSAGTTAYISAPNSLLYGNSFVHP